MGPVFDEMLKRPAHNPPPPRDTWILGLFDERIEKYCVSNGCSCAILYSWCLLPKSDLPDLALEEEE